MAYQIEIDSKKAYEWLKKLVENTIESPSSRPMELNYEEVMEWKAAFDECDRKREEAAAERKKARMSTKKSSGRKKTTRRKKKSDSPFDCVEHSTYGGVRMPRTDCTKCWSIYEKLHPQEYDRARRKFELKQKRKQNNK